MIVSFVSLIYHFKPDNDVLDECSLLAMYSGNRSIDHGCDSDGECSGIVQHKQWHCTTGWDFRPFAIRVRVLSVKPAES